MVIAPPAGTCPVVATEAPAFDDLAVGQRECAAAHARGPLLDQEVDRAAVRSDREFDVCLRPARRCTRCESCFCPGASGASTLTVSPSAHDRVRRQVTLAHLHARPCRAAAAAPRRVRRVGRDPRADRPSFRSTIRSSTDRGPVRARPRHHDVARLDGDRRGAGGVVARRADRGVGPRGIGVDRRREVLDVRRSGRSAGRAPPCRRGSGSGSALRRRRSSSRSGPARRAPTRWSRTRAPGDGDGVRRRGQDDAAGGNGGGCWAAEA